MKPPVPSTEAALDLPYLGQGIALLTQHGKEGVIASVLDAALGCRVQRVSGYDTDQLGTFTRELPRAGTQIEAARRKARIGMELSGLPLGLASEGAFGPDPMVGMLPWNREVVLFIDDEAGLEVMGVAQGKAHHFQRLTADWSAASAFAREAGFPEHYLVLRPQGEHDPRLRKGLATWDDLEAAYAWAQALATNGQVWVETDLRAHANPTRMEMIREAAKDLLHKLASRCPACDAPGFWVLERIAGLPCAQCGAPTPEPRAELYACLKCTHQETRRSNGPAYAAPSRCAYCNP